jgi:hypothetical protein
MPFIKSIRKQYDSVQQGPKVTDFYDIQGGDIVYTAGGYAIHMFTSVGESEFKMVPKPQFQNNREVVALQGQLAAEFGVGVDESYFH